MLIYRTADGLARGDGEDILLLDLYMPRLPGLEAISRYGYGKLNKVDILPRI